MRKIFKLLGFLSAILCLFFVVAILAFYYLTRVGELRRYLVDEIEKQTELKAQVRRRRYRNRLDHRRRFSKRCPDRSRRGATGDHRGAGHGARRAAAAAAPAGDLL